jgi:hypothetical protein
MKFSRVKNWLMAAGGFVAFQAAGCNFLEQIQDFLPNFPTPGV